MSIIYDALKKVERINYGGKSVAADKRHKPNLKILLFYVLIVGIGFFFGNVIFNFFTKHQQGKTPVLTTANLADKSRPAQTKQNSKSLQELPKAEITSPSETTSGVSAKPKEQPKPALVLNGIFSSGEEGYALINNQIVKVGDVVDGAKVARIDLDGVQLEINGSTIKLNNK
jgi:type II secretory pathway component PulC